MSFAQLPHYRPETPPAPIARPAAVVVARCAAAAQVAISAAVAGWFGYSAATVPVDQNPEAYGEVWQLICAAGSTLTALMTLLVAVPALRLRRGGSGARITLIVVEIICAVPVLVALPMAVNGRGLAGYAALLTAYAMAGAIVVAAVSRDGVRAWSEQ